MRIDADEGSTRDPAEVEELNRDGAWFVVFKNPDPTTASLAPFIVHGVDGMESADAIAAALVSKYPDRGVYMIGLSRGDVPMPARLVLHGPEDENWNPPKGEEAREAIAQAKAHLDFYRRRELANRDRMARMESQETPPPMPPADVTADHLYANKAAFPRVGKPAIERDCPPGEEDCRPLADGTHPPCICDPGKTAGKGGES